MPAPDDVLHEALGVLEVIVHDAPADEFSDARAVIPRLKAYLSTPKEPAQQGVIYCAAPDCDCEPGTCRRPHAPADRAAAPMPSDGWRQALDALDELEAAARGDEPFPYSAAPLIRRYIESTLAAAPDSPAMPSDLHAAIPATSGQINGAWLQWRASPGFKLARDWPLDDALFVAFRAGLNARHAAAELVASSPAAPQEPPGWRLVPVQPTNAMLEAAYKAFIVAAPSLIGFNAKERAYKALLQHVPPHPSDAVAPPELVRYCYECGSFGEVRPGARDCCPDGIAAARLPRHWAERLEREISGMRTGAARYEFIRTLDPRAYRELWEANIRGDGPFDDLVDAARKAQARL